MTYTALPDGAELPEQPEQIAASVQIVVPDAVLRARILAASPHAQLISERLQQRIRDRYAVEDEMYFARIGTGHALGIYTYEPGEEAALLEYGAYIESVRQWARDERAKLGL